MKYLKTYITLVIATFTVFLGLILSDEASASELKFSVETKIPENQIDKSKTYFNLKVEKNQEQTLEIELKNDTNEDVVVVPEISSATTNINGVVEYTKKSGKYDSTLKYKLEDIIDVAQEVKIPAKGSSVLALNLKVPNEPFQGVIAGGISLTEKENDKYKKDNSNRGLSIENKYSYVVGIVLDENLEEIKQELNLLEVSPGQVNSRNVINMKLQNPTPSYINKFSVDAKVMKDGKKDVLYSIKKDNMQIAPNSNFELPISLEGEKLVPGDYTLILNAKSSKENWEFKENFTIKDVEAKKLNKEDVEIDNNNLLIILMATLFTLILLALIFICIKKGRS